MHKLSFWYTVYSISIYVQMITGFLLQSESLLTEQECHSSYCSGMMTLVFSCAADLCTSAVSWSSTSASPVRKKKINHRNSNQTLSWVGFFCQKPALRQTFASCFILCFQRWRPVKKNQFVSIQSDGQRNLSDQSRYAVIFQEMLLAQEQNLG